MLRYLFLLPIIILTIQGFSQCDPDPNVPVEGTSLFPLPFGVIPPEQGGTGITDTAFIGVPYQMTFTLIFPDTFLDPATQSITVGDSILIEPDSLRVMFGEEEVGLPDGLSIISNPEGFIQANPDGPAGCVSLFGTPTADAVPGDYLLFFGVTACIQNPALTGCTFVEIPSIFANILGEYRLTVADRTSSIPEVLNDSQNLQINPNPFDSNVIIKFNSKGLTGDYQLSVLNLAGQKVIEQSVRTSGGNQQIALDASTWQDGLYLFSLNGKEGQLSGKLIKR